MPVDAINALVPAVALRPAPAPLSWPIGELLSAKVIGAASANSTQLRVGGHIVTARTDVALQPGQEIKLRVAANTPMIVLRLERAVQPAAVAVERGLARSLPRQGSAAETLQLLRTLAAQPPMPTTPSAAPWPSTALDPKHAAAALLRAMPERAELLEPRNLRSAIERSAAPAEAVLQQSVKLHQTPVDALALPRGLHQLAGALNAATNLPSASRPGGTAALAPPYAPGVDTRQASLSLPDAPPAVTDRPSAIAEYKEPAAELPRLRELVDGALARLQVHQLQNALQAAIPSTPLVAELFVRDGDRIDLWRFEMLPERGCAKGGCAEDLGVSITVRMLIGESSSFDARLTARDGALHIQLGSHDPIMAATIGLHLHEFEQRMRSRGVALASLFVGQVPDAATRPPLQRNLVDESI